MLNLREKSAVSDVENGNHKFSVLVLEDDEFSSLVDGLIETLPDHYVELASVADTLRRLGKKAAAQKLLTKIPEAQKIRSGDIGEVLAADYVEQYTGYSIPIKKLRWRDHRNMPMRGDDVIGFIIDLQKQTLNFIKVEAKSVKSLGRKVLGEARDELDLDDGLPAPHALEFIAERLRETGNVVLSDLIEKVQLVDTISANQVEHLLFTYTASNPDSLQKEAFEAYGGTYTQNSVGLRVTEHQKLISDVYEGLIDGLDD